MTFVDVGAFRRSPLTAGRASDTINKFFRHLSRVGGAEQIEALELGSSPQLNPAEECLRLIQENISNISMHLPKGFVAGLNRQFANMMDDDAWESDDELIGRTAINSFLQTLLSTHTKRRPGIGTNGRGSITATWTEGDNRLTIECLASGKISVVLSRKQVTGEIERAAFGPTRPDRIRDLLAPFDPEIWFGC